MKPLRRLIENDTIQRLSGAGAIDRLATICEFTSTDAAQALTLEDGLYHGHRIRISHVTDGGSGVLTAGTNWTAAHSVAAVTLTNKGEWVELVWNAELDTPAWVVAGCSSVGILS